MMIPFRYIVLGLIGIMAACNQEEIRDPWKLDFWGEVTLVENGVLCADCKTRAAKYGRSENSVSLEFNHVNNEGYSTAEFSFNPVHIDSVGIQQVLRPDYLLDLDNWEVLRSNYATSQELGHVSGDRYDVLESEDNWLLVTEWDMLSGEIKGEFQVVYVYRGLRTGKERVFPQDSDTIRITNGSFHTRIVD